MRPALILLLLLLAACGTSEPRTDAKYRSCVIYQTEAIGLSPQDAAAECADFQ